MTGAGAESLKRIPAVDRLLHEPAIAALRPRLSHETVVGLIREVLAEVRGRALSGAGDPAELAPAGIAAKAAALLTPRLRPVINATGILIHTNLGRAPLAPSAQEAATRVAAGYASLEMDLASARRISRLDAVRERLCQLTGAEDALAVNNNAAAVFLVLHVLSAGREVIVSRGELVEIGGSFRLPDIMQASGAALREVGTTNRTRLSDYRAAVGPRTGAILKVHPSNFVMRGFTEAVPVKALAGLAREHGLPLVEDVGSGALTQHPPAYMHGEPRIQDSLREGADLVTCSGDKLLGGPQAGLILGAAAWVSRLRAHPLARILRLDKLHLAALEATLLEYLCGDEGLARIPLYRMMSRPLETLKSVGAEMLARMAAAGIPRECLALAETEAAAGGGSLPQEHLPSIAVTLELPGGSLDDFARRLRTGVPAIVGRLEQNRLLLDLRALNEEEWGVLPERVAAVWAESRPRAAEGRS
jgi:L-seryl-tRNA(Ser) seleniumtransferase